MPLQVPQEPIFLDADPVRLEQEQREHRPLPGAAQRHRTSGPTDLQRPENAELRELGLAGHRVSSHRTHPARLVHPAARARGFGPFHHQTGRSSRPFPSRRSRPIPG